MGNSGGASYSNSAGSNPTTNPMLLAYMANNLEGDYGIWNDYGGWHYAWTYAYRNRIVADALNPATIDDPANPGQTIPNPDIGLPILQKYLQKQIWTGLAATAVGVPSGTSEWARLRTTKLVSADANSAPLTYLDNGDPRWLQFILAEVAMPRTGTVYADASVAPQTLGYVMGLGPPRLMQLWPEVGAAADVTPGMNMFKMGHTKHHGVETQAWIGALISMVTSVRDANTHTHQNFNTNGLPNSVANPLQQQIAQEIATDGTSLFSVPDNSGSGEWAWDIAGTATPINRARVSFVVQSVIMYEVQNSLTECNYTLPVWASPLKSRNYRGDMTLSAQVMAAVTGETVSQKDLERIGLRNFTLMRVLYALLMGESGKNMRANFDQIANWNFSDKGTKTSSAYILPRGELETAKDYLYDALGWDRATGLPTRQTLVALGLDFVVPRLDAAGLIPAAAV
jgi:hypothetical protein